MVLPGPGDLGGPQVPAGDLGGPVRGLVGTRRPRLPAGRGLQVRPTVGPAPREERVVATLAHLGPAVLHGGLSTLLAFLLLATSDSYIFIAFFKV